MALLCALAGQDAVDNVDVMLQHNVVRIELPFQVAASAPASHVGTTVSPWLGARVGYRFDLSRVMAPGVGGGGDVGVYAGGWENEGTDKVGVTKFFATSELRGLMSYDLVANHTATLTALGTLGVRAGAGPLLVRAFEDRRSELIGLWGARAGVGLDLSIAHISPRTELAIGVRDGRLEFSSSLAVGVVF